ncbi:conserved hypothetical protein [Leishmania infantum JPCM5]|uniref:Uncharacterized protein n=2 Tax=Leishmania infantum TaxID=5671 RepID=A4HVI8_LEIIN|nr:conserved hypothetical protein [Leishmania infantum JPCM5]CAC9465440.1 hypothetical_protein_-_conserved [Leishmania infantum]CAM66454.1 conserved hypothetical protein [Leishmania infantum JPCM5]SUZ40108.1 hypothetical_protein_-_conserved [Leishmania infantum]|eukprot:XP_001464079.1 conserved hypothetical protein [Leishmania infantum JPCM5]
MDLLNFISLAIELRDYPGYATCIRATEYPGLALCEYSAVTGMRYTVPLGYAASAVYFYLYHRPRLSFADRSLTKLHHYFYPSAGYSTPLGIIGGVLYGAAECVQGLTPAALEATAAREKAAAVMAAEQYSQRHRAAKQRLKAEQSFASKALAWLRLCEDPVQAELARMGLGEDSIAWETLLVPQGYLWTQLHSVVHDPARYRGYEAPVAIGAAVPTSTDERLSQPSGGASTPCPSPSGVLSFSRAYFTKPQVDAVVSRIGTLRTSPEDDRWMRSAGRCGAYGVFGMLLTWNSGGALFRAQMGLGLGVTIAGLASATRLDEVFAHL